MLIFKPYTLKNTISVPKFNRHTPITNNQTVKT